MKSARNSVGSMDDLPCGTAGQYSPRPQPASPRPQTVSPRPQTVGPRPQTVGPCPQPASPRPKTASPRPQTSSPRPQTVSPRPQTASPRPQTASSRPQTVSPRPQTASPHPQTDSSRPSSSVRPPQVPALQLDTMDDDEGEDDNTQCADDGDNIQDSSRHDLVVPFSPPESSVTRRSDKDEHQREDGNNSNRSHLPGSSNKSSKRHRPPNLDLNTDTPCTDFSLSSPRVNPSPGPSKKGKGRSKVYLSPRSPFVRSPRSPAVSARHWRPVMPGYTQEANSTGQRLVIQRTVSMGNVSQQPEGSELQDAIPAMPYPVAIGCLLLNVICPGLGTFLSSLTVLCCAKKRGDRDKGGIIWLNSWVGLFQLLLTPLMLLGWIWSVKWGLLFVTISEEEYNATDNDGETPGESESDIPASHRHRYRFHETPQHTTTTTVSLPQASTSGLGVESRDHIQPIIVLQEAPVVIHQDGGLLDMRGSLPRRPRGLNPHNPRHQRILRQQNTVYEEDVPPVLLNPETLEDIVVRNGVPLSEVSDK